MTVLTSLHNRHLRLARSLVRARDRQKTGLYRLEGRKLVGEALQAGASLEYVLYAPALADQTEGQVLLGRLRAAGVPCYPVAEKLWSELSGTVTPQGILAVVRREESDLADLFSRMGQGLVLVLDGVQDPGNTGTLIRTAAAAGCVGLVALTGTADLYQDKVLRAAAGAQFLLPVVTRVAPQACVAAAKAANRPIVLAVPAGGCHYTHFDWRRPLLLVVGNEGQGPRPEMAAAAAAKVTVPMVRGESLNVAVATAVLLFEAVRQRGGGH